MEGVEVRDIEASERRQMSISTGLHRGCERVILCLEGLWVFGRGVWQMPVELISWRTAIVQHSGLWKGKTLEKAKPSWEVCYGDIGLGRDLSICQYRLRRVWIHHDQEAGSTQECWTLVDRHVHQQDE